MAFTVRQHRVGEDFVPPLPQYAGLIPPLDAVRVVDPAVYCGPTEESNWVVPSRLLVGAYPGAVHDELNDRILRGILDLGVRTFVCLQQEYEHNGVSEAEWRSGVKLRPYIFDAARLLNSIPSHLASSNERMNQVEFVHFPIQDVSIASDASVLQLCHLLVKRLVKGEVMYVHCESTTI